MTETYMPPGKTDRREMIRDLRSSTCRVEHRAHDLTDHAVRS